MFTSSQTEQNQSFTNWTNTSSVTLHLFSGNCGDAETHHTCNHQHLSALHCIQTNFQMNPLQRLLKVMLSST